MRQSSFPMFVLALLFTAQSSISATSNTFNPLHFAVTSNGANGNMMTISNPFSNASAIVTGIVMLTLGFLFVFFGRKLFHITLFLAGAMIGVFIALTILVNAEPVNTDPSTGVVTSAWGEKRDWIYLGVCLAAGIIFGLISNFLWKLGLFSIGAYGGFALSLFILSWSSGTLIPNNVGRTVFIVIFCIAGGILSLILEHHVVVVSTAVAGSYSMCFGIDCFTKTGFNQATLAVLGGHPEQFQISNNGMYGLLISMIVLAILGILIQEKITGLNAVKIGGRRRKSQNQIAMMRQNGSQEFLI